MPNTMRVGLLLFAVWIVIIGAMTTSKLSIHTSMSGSNSWSVVQQGQPQVIKLLDTFSPSFQIKQDDPGVVIVGRIYLPNQPQSGDPTTTAQDWWNYVYETVLGNNTVDYWEGYNEPDVSSNDAMNWYTSFEQERVQILSQNGKKASIGNFATGTPDVTNSAIIEAFYPAIQTAMSYGGILGLHEYSAPYMNSSFSGSVQTGTGWLTGRYRMLYDNFLIPAGLVIPLVISECGIDGGTCSINGCDISGGWQNFCGYWQTSDCSSTYMTQLEWYDSLLLVDDYVMGATIFQLEDDSGDNWASFDLTPVVPDFISYLQSMM